jgi:cytochrome c-type biogenesis protein
MDEALVSRHGTLWAPLVLLAGLLGLSSAAVHLIVTPAHFQEWLGYGVFFLVLAALQAIYGLGFLMPQARFARSPWYLLAGILGSLVVMAVYAVSRTLGIPLLGPHAGHIEGLGAVDVFSKALELGLVATLTGLLLRVVGFEPRFWTRATFALVGMLVLIVALVMASVTTRAQPESLAAPRQAQLRTAAGAPAQTLPTLRELLPLLTRNGYGPGSTSVDVVYAPPLLFQVDGEEPPASSLERSTVIFMMLEADHQHEVGLAPEPPQVFLRLDGGELVEPYEVTVLADGLEHRTSQLLFPLPSGLYPGAIDQQKHTLTVVIPLGSVGESTFSWRLPLGLPGEVTSPSVPDGATGLQATALPRTLTRTRQGMEYGDKGGIRVDATYATPDYFSTALTPEAASRYLPDRFAVLLVSETSHSATLPPEPLTVSLRLDGQQYQPDLAEQVVSSPHHRVTLVRFPVGPPLGLRHRVMEVVLPGDERLVWHLPILGDSVRSGSGFQVTWGSLLAVMGGMVAAMWPCLFQLTAFFIPALAGLNMQEAGGSVALGRRMGVIKAALFFVLGFTLVYTAAGALIGFAAQRLGDSANFEVWQRYLAIGGGVAIILLALRVAAKVRAPLVCKMPVLSRMAHRRSASSPLEMMFAGVAFATGCMTCFGAALVVTMVVYVGLSGSPAFGALTLLLFSLGMGIPLVLAASAMAKVLPMLFRLEKVIPWLGLASSLVMVGFGVLLITGNYMALTGWVYRLIPPVIIR